jgi:hypothetical protein
MPPTRIPPLLIDSVIAKEMAPASGLIYDLIASASQNDTVVDFVQQNIHDGWPEARAGFPQCFRFLRPHCHELRVADGVVIDSRNKVYVPEAAHHAMIQELHIGHPGQSTMLARARKIFFRANMQSDMEKLAVTCGICALHRPSQAREPLQPRDMPPPPPRGSYCCRFFSRFARNVFLAIYDVFLQFPFLWLVHSESTAELLHACRAFFQFTGCPRAFWCDQGSAFDSNEFRAFADSIGMRVCYSSAEYAQSNGAAKSAVKILKQLQQVSLNENELFWVLLYLQNFAKRRHAAAPAEIFIGHSLQTPLQAQSNQSFVLWRDHHSEQTSEQGAMKAQYDRCATRTAKDYKQGDRILVHNVCGKTAQATVVEQTDRRTYLVEFPNSSRSIRTHRFLTFIPGSSDSGLPTASRPTSDTTTPGGSSKAAPKRRSPHLVKTSP